MKVEKDYEELLKLLNKHRVRYCIVGAYAVALYGYPRYTKDIDILVEPSLKNAEKILKALKDFGFGSLKLKREDFIKKDNIIQLGYEPVRVDFLTFVPNYNFSQIWKNKKSFLYGKTRVYFIGKKELINSKKISDRKIDRLDLENL
ncbi:MAG: nucleotidyltransferase family protein [Candidatus Omnitrophica bacterium]|nr:nucleotidyltransferase family protein [Candidatus Omnitrophota bacterium]